MADTTKIKTVIEPYIRDWLAKQFPGHVFEERPIQLTSGGSYIFDAVSEDSSIVAAILSNRASTRTGRENTGGVRKALTELSYLKAVPADIEKVMVFTDDRFCQLVQHRATRLGRKQIKMIVCVLPPRLKALLKEILDRASYEQRAAD
jgi:hypothetical protein